MVREGVLTAFVCVCLFTVEVGHGHGPAPSPLRVLQVTGGNADIIQTNIGLAIHSGDGAFQYGCPSQWGDLETPLAVATDSDVIFVTGAEVFVASEDRGCNFSTVENPEGIDTRRVSGLVSAQDTAWGSEKGDDAARLFTWRPNEPISVALRLPQPIDSLIAHSDRLYAAGARPSLGLYRVELPFSGAPASLIEPQQPTEAPIQRFSLRRVDPDDPDRLWAVATTEEGLSWWRSDDGGLSFEALADAMISIHGPVAVCGGVAAVIDGILTPDPDMPPSCDLTELRERRLNCLGERDGLAWTCELRQLFELVEPGDDGPLRAELVFGLEQLEGPAEGCPGGEEARRACDLDWLHFGAEAGLLDPEDIFGTPDTGPQDPPDVGVSDASDDPPPPPPPEAGDGGCSATGGEGGFGAWWLVLLLLTPPPVPLPARRRGGTLPGRWARQIECSAQVLRPDNQ